MNTRTLCIGMIGTLLASTAALAQPSPPPTSIDWSTIDGGGEMFSISRAIQLGGTIGQPDASWALTSADGRIEVTGGFWVVTLESGGSPPCTGDLDHDGDIDISDLSTLLSNFGTASGATFEQGDSDGDGDVDITDLAALLGVFGTNCR